MPTVAFFRDLLGLRLALQLDDFWVLKLPGGSKVEVFGPDSPTNRHFTTGPVAGFLVDDVFGATDELRSAGVEILLEPVVDDSGNAWVHFRAPDGNIYEFTQDPGVSRPASCRRGASKLRSTARPRQIRSLLPLSSWRPLDLLRLTRLVSFLPSLRGQALVHTLLLLLAGRGRPDRARWPKPVRPRGL